MRTSLLGSLKPGPVGSGSRKREILANCGVSAKDCAPSGAVPVDAFQRILFFFRATGWGAGRWCSSAEVAGHFEALLFG